MKRGASSGANWWKAPAGSRRSISLAEVTVPVVISACWPSWVSRSMSGSSESASPTLAPCSQTNGPSGRARAKTPRRSSRRIGSSLPRLRRSDSKGTASGVASQVASRYPPSEIDALIDPSDRPRGPWPRTAHKRDGARRRVPPLQNSLIRCDAVLTRAAAHRAAESVDQRRQQLQRRRGEQSAPRLGPVVYELVSVDVPHPGARLDEQNLAGRDVPVVGVTEAIAASSEPSATRASR